MQMYVIKTFGGKVINLMEYEMIVRVDRGSLAAHQAYYGHVRADSLKVGDTIEIPATGICQEDHIKSIEKIEPPEFPCTCNQPPADEMCPQHGHKRI